MSKTKTAYKYELKPHEKILEGLNEEQTRAVTHGEGPLLIVAGAGTGKTTVITRRIAYLLATKKARPEEILAVTFTDKAASEMEERVDILVPYGYTNVWISTFHAFGDRVLREHTLDLGLSPDFRVMTKPEQMVFFREHLFEFPLEYYRPLGNPTRYIDSIITLMSRARDEEITPEEYIEYAKALKDKARPSPLDRELYESSRLRPDEQSEREEEIAKTYKKYQELKAQHGKIDFGDQINLVIKLFRTRPSILKEYQEKFRYILIDEFQDTNYAQFQMVKLLGSSHRNLTVVGDDDQSIYKFRGAAISNILGFMESYPEANQIVLKDNYRSSQIVLDRAYQLIRFNDPDRLEVKNNIDKKLQAVNRQGNDIKHQHFDTVSSESDFVAKTIEHKAKNGKYQYRDFAILVRANRDADPFLRSLNIKGIPWYFSGSQGLYGREEIRLLISFLKVVTNFSDSLSLYYLASSEIYGLNMSALTLCMNYAKRHNRSLYYVFKNIDRIEELEEINSQSRKKIDRIMSDIKIYNEKSRHLSTGHLLYSFINDKGYLKRLSHEETQENEEKIRNIAKFFDLISRFSHIAKIDHAPQFIEQLDLLIEVGDDPSQDEHESFDNNCQVLTFHKAKGLEFPVVFMVSLVSDRFPTRHKREAIPLPDKLVKDILPTGDFHIQEERRLFYVGMTRTKRELYFTSAENYGGVRSRKVSQFVLEALDQPRADIKVFKSTALESIQRHAAQKKTKIDRISPREGIINLSYYQIDDYLTCPLKYKYIHILRVPILQHHTVVYGKALHDAISQYHLMRMKGERVTLEQFFSIFENLWRSEGFLTREHEEKRFQTGKEALAKFYSSEEKSPYLPKFVEEKFSFILGENRIVGRWDRIDIRDNNVYVIDYKSSDVKKQKDADKRTKDSLQLAMYTFACRERFPNKNIVCQLHFLESGLIGEVIYKESKLSKTEAKIEEAARGIRALNYRATPGYISCRYCAYNQICPSTAYSDKEMADSR